MVGMMVTRTCQLANPVIGHSRNSREHNYSGQLQEQLWARHGFAGRVSGCSGYRKCQLGYLSVLGEPQPSSTPRGLAGGS